MQIIRIPIIVKIAFIIFIRTACKYFNSALIYRALFSLKRSTCPAMHYLTDPPNPKAWGNLFPEILTQCQLKQVLSTWQLSERRRWHFHGWHSHEAHTRQQPSAGKRIAGGWGWPWTRKGQGMWGSTEEFKWLGKNGNRQRSHCVSESRQLLAYRSLFF